MTLTKSTDDGVADLITLKPHPADTRIAVITLNRPAMRNSFTIAMSERMRQVQDEVEASPIYRVAILRAEGPVFCAGMDLGEFAAGGRPEIATGDGFANFVHRKRRKPFIAAVQGGAFAGGMEIMLACDMAIATEGARFALPEVKRGIIAAGGGAIRLPRQLPSCIAKEILLTGNVLKAERALALGLLNALVPAEAIDEAVFGLASAVAANAPLAVTGTKAVADAALTGTEADGWAAIETEWDVVIASSDATEGALAFKEKRDPIWRGK